MTFGPLITAADLAAQSGRVHVVDVRWYLDGRSGDDAYAAGHLPGAVRLDIDSDLSDPANPALGRHPLPSPERFAAALGRVGVAAGDPVVAYDDAGGSVAARLWWLLHVLGEPAAVLDGGLAAWDGPLSTEVPVVTPVERPARAWPAARFVRADDLLDQSHVLDARSAARYAKGDPAVDPRPGHVPGARSVPWADNLDADGRFHDRDTLRRRYADVLGARTAAYCGSGVTACHDLLALTVAGHEDLALYPGSWSQWGADPSRPTELGQPARWSKAPPL